MAKIRGIKPDYWTDEDIVDLSIPARLLFIGLWNLACDNGHLDDKARQIKMKIFPADDLDVEPLLEELATKDRIVREGGTITIPKFAHHQKPHRRWWTTCDLPWCNVPEGATSTPDNRGKGSSTAPRNGGTTVDHGRSTADVDVEGDGDSEGDTTPRRLTLAETPRDDVERICIHLADRIEANGAKRPTIGKSWRDAARLMLDRDGRTEAEVHGAIDWCQSDEFWRANVLSLPKLREKYDQLRLQAQRRAGASSRQQQTDDIFDRAARRMGVTP